MSKISIVRQRYANGDSMRKIAREEGMAWRTVKKMLSQEDFSPPVPVRQQRPSKLDAHKDFIDGILEGDGKVWHKQRHTATRIYERLVAERGFDGSYGIVRTYVRERRLAMGAARGTFNDLVWEPGFAQADFGEADFAERGAVSRKSFLAMAFPNSNQGFPQVFGGETAECFCQGFKDIFEFIGGVPHTIVIDNTTAAGRRVAGRIRESDLFMRFRLHYGFAVRFTNPDSGHEKGSVEAKVKWIRSNMFVPIPAFDDIEAYNAGLLRDSLAQGAKEHYRKGSLISELFARDQSALLALPERPFDVVRYERRKTNKLGNILTDGQHTYSVTPAMALTDVTVAFRAHAVEVYGLDGGLAASHRRVFGKGPSESIDHSRSLATLASKPGAWQQSRLRQAVDRDVRDFLDSQPREMLAEYLRCMRDQSARHPFEAVMDAMGLLVSRGGAFSASDVGVMVQRVEGFGIGAEPDPGPELGYYDSMLLGGRP